MNTPLFVAGVLVCLVVIGMAIGIVRFAARGGNPVTIVKAYAAGGALLLTFTLVSLMALR